MLYCILYERAKVWCGLNRPRGGDMATTKGRSRGTHRRRRLKYTQLNRDARTRRPPAVQAHVPRGLILPSAGDRSDEELVLFLVSALTEYGSKPEFGLECDFTLSWVKRYNPSELSGIFDQYINNIWNVTFEIFHDANGTEINGWVFERT